MNWLVSVDATFSFFFSFLFSFLTRVDEITKVPRSTDMMGLRSIFLLPPRQRWRINFCCSFDARNVLIRDRPVSPLRSRATFSAFLLKFATLCRLSVLIAESTRSNVLGISIESHRGMVRQTRGNDNSQSPGGELCAAFDAVCVYLRELLMRRVPAAIVTQDPRGGPLRAPAFRFNDD